MNDGIPVKDEDFPLTIRNMRPGDRMETAGGTKRFLDFLLMRKFPTITTLLAEVVLDCRGNILLVQNCENKEYLSINPDLFGDKTNNDYTRRYGSMHKDMKEILFTTEQISNCKELGAQISKDYEGKKILLIGLLKDLFHS